MAGILPRGNVIRQAQIAAKRLVAKDFAFCVQTHRGADIRNYSSDAKTKLVEAELEMVRAAWLLQHRSVVRRFYCVSRVDRIHRSEIDRRLQRCLSPGEGAPCGRRGPWFAYYRGISCIRKHKRQRRIRRSKPLDSHLRSKGKRNNLRSGNEVGWPVELFEPGPGGRHNASTHRSSPTTGTGKSALIIRLQRAIRNLSVSAILLGILAGIVGVACGLILGFAVGSALAAALHVPAREGEAAYFTVAIALIVTVIVTPLSILVTLYWRGVRSI
jgi:hypothetical protein